MKRVPYIPTANDSQAMICYEATVGEMLNNGFVVLPRADLAGRVWVKIPDRVTA